MAKSGPKKSKSQVAKFRETARTLEADQDEVAFDATLKRMARATPPPKESKSQPKKPGR